MKLAIVGAGGGGANLIEALHGLDGLEIGMVIDVNEQAPGIQMAKERGISVSTDMTQINVRDYDAVIEATGVPIVREKLEDHLQGMCKLIDAEVAKMLMTIVDVQVALTEKLNHQMSVLQETVSKLEEQTGEIASSVEVLGGVSDQLTQSTNASAEFIEESDSMIGSINKISNQVKILGINANIEAARAGEHGRGFSVVASEIQKLSDDTARFAGEIGTLLASMSTENVKVGQQVRSLESINDKQTNVSSNVQELLDELVGQFNLHQK